MKSIVFSFLLAIFCFGNIFVPVVHANDLQKVLQNAGVNSGEQDVPLPKINDKTTSETKINHLIYTAIRILLIMAGIVGVLLITWGGFRYATSIGEKGPIDNAKKVIIGAITGLLVILFTYALLTNIISFLEFAE